MKVICVANFKGGVTKTSTCVLLATCLTEKGYKVLCIDLDPQSNLSVNSQIKISGTFGIIKVFGEERQSIRENIVHTEHYDVVPCCPQLSNLTDYLKNEPGGQLILKSCIVSEKLDETYDFIIIDTSPSRNVFTDSAFIASDEIIIPVTPDRNPMDGIGSVIDIYRKTIRNTYLNPNLKIAGLLRARWIKNRRTSKIGDELLEKKAETYGLKIFDTAIRDSSKVQESSFYRANLLDFAKSNGVVEDYKAFTEELLKEVTRDEC